MIDRLQIYEAYFKKQPKTREQNKIEKQGIAAKNNSDKIKADKSNLFFRHVGLNSINYKNISRANSTEDLLNKNNIYIKITNKDKTELPSYFIDSVSFAKDTISIKETEIGSGYMNVFDGILSGSLSVTLKEYKKLNIQKFIKSFIKANMNRDLTFNYILDGLITITIKTLDYYNKANTLIEGKIFIDKEKYLIEGGQDLEFDTATPEKIATTLTFKKFIV